MNVSVRSFRAVAALLVLLGGLFSAPATAAARGSKLDKILREAASRPPKPHQVIIRTTPGSREAVKQALRAHGDVIVAEHPSLDALTVTLHGEDLLALERDGNVLSVSIDAEVRSFGSAKRSQAPGLAGKTRNTATDSLRATLGLDDVWYSGAGVGIAVVDSGIEPNRDLVSSIKGFWDFTVGGVPVRPYDDYGHGTHVAGLIASDGFASHRRFAGVAPGVDLFGFKVLDRYGRGRASTVIRALEWILANHSTKGIHIVNLSLGHPIYQDAAHDPLVVAVENLVKAGLIVVVAAGNVGVDADGLPGYAGITAPGNAPSAVTVGAADTKQTVLHSDDRVAFFSSRGPSWYDGYAKPDVVAPAVALTSNAAKYSELFKQYPQLKAQLGNGKGSLASLSGTSMAAAVASGVAALLVEAGKPGVAPGVFKALLQYTALPLRDDAGNLYDALTQGTGKVNPLGALAMIEALDPSVPLGTAWIVPRPATFTSLGGESIEWARGIIWDDTLVVNPAAIWLHAAQWGQCDPAVDPDCENIVWGTGYTTCEASDPECENIVWGTGLACDAADPNCENIVWGTLETENIVWGSSAVWTGSIVWEDRVLGMFNGDENIVWGTNGPFDEENIVWGTYDGENIVWGTYDGENIVWGTYDGENLVWGSSACDAAVDPACDNIVWGSGSSGGDGDENIVWGTRRTLERKDKGR